MSKKRILFAVEAHYLNTGFATYGRNVMSEWHKTDKYELAEFAIYGQSIDRQIGRPGMQVPWDYYANKPNDGENAAEHDNNPVNQFGAWRFEDVLLHFKPHYVCTIADPWQFMYQTTSPYRHLFKHVLMPTVDSQPHRAEWLAAYSEADAVFAYNDWSLEVMRRESNGKIPLRQSAPPGANMEVYTMAPHKKNHKLTFGVPEDSFIVGMVARNQKRKLFPDLMAAFSLFLKQNPDIANKCYLYLHTSYPDLGWDLPFLIKEHGLSRHIMTTYHCHQCGSTFPSYWRDARTTCHSCQQPTATLCNVNSGASDEIMCQIYNLFDIYVQYATNEGFGMPQVEAAACGVPVVGSDYSAVGDIVSKLEGTLIRPLAHFLEIETTAYKFIPDNTHLPEILRAYYDLPESEKEQRRQTTRQKVLEHYTYSQTAKAWEKYFDSEELDDRWSSPPDIQLPNLNVPANMSDSRFVDWAICEILRKPDKINSYLSVQLNKFLNYGLIPANGGGNYINEDSYFGARPMFQPCTSQTIINLLAGARERINYWESVRAGTIPRPKQQFLVEMEMEHNAKRGNRQ